MDARNDSDNISTPIAVEDTILDTNEFFDVSQISFGDTLVPQETGNSDQANAKIPDMDESLILEINEDDEENKWNKWHPKALKTRVSNVLRSDKASKASVTSKLDKLSAARLELVQLQMESARKEQQFIEEEHKLKIFITS